MTLSLFGKERDDVSTAKKRGISQWKVATISQGDEEKKIRKKTVYSFWSATKYVMILSLLLWWLPVFGQMIAGYVGGRKAGGPWRGVAAAILPVIAIFSVMTAIDYFLPQYVGGNGSASASLLTGLVGAVPFVGPYLDFTREYVMQFIASLQGASPYQMNSYLLTIAFAYVGGILADQSRREIEAASGQAGNHTTVMFAPNSNEQLHASRSSFVHPAAVSHATWGFLPHFSFRRSPMIKSFDQLVPENANAEDEAPVSKRGRTVHRRVVRNVRSSSDRGKPSQAKRIQVNVHKERPKHQVKVSASNPRTLIKAEKMIDREWDPKRRKNSSPWIVRRESGRHSSSGTKTRSKNWESF